MTMMAKSTEKLASILIVEDNVNLNLMFTKYLKAHGYAITNAYSLRAALDMLASLPAPNVIVVDLELPDGSSNAILKMLKHPKFERTRVVLVSGKPFSMEHPDAPYAATQLLMKPVAPRGLATLVEALLH
jgi:DNA-binding response OmpR family regulator